MKKTIVAWSILVIIGTFMPVTITAQSVEPQTDAQKEIMITILLQIVELLRAQLALLQAQEARITAPTPQPVQVAVAPTPDTKTLVITSKPETNIGGNCEQAFVTLAVRNQNGENVAGETIQFTNPETGQITSRVTQPTATFVYSPLSTSTTETLVFEHASSRAAFELAIYQPQLSRLVESAGAQVDLARGVCI